MEGTYHLIVRKPYEDISVTFLRWLVANADNYLIGQHDADEDINTTHCHISFTNLKKTGKALDKQRLAAKLDGQVSRLLKHVVGTRELYDEEKLNIYILKGNRELLKSTSHSVDVVEQWVSAWVNHSHTVVRKVEEDDDSTVVTSKKYNEYAHIKSDFEAYYMAMNKPIITLDSMRTWVMRWYWKRDGRMPPATAYKRNVASLYVYSVEIGNRCLDAAFEELKNLWGF